MNTSLFILLILLVLLPATDAVGAVCVVCVCVTGAAAVESKCYIFQESPFGRPMKKLRRKTSE